jgi:hypothetical protein
MFSGILGMCFIEDMALMRMEKKIAARLGDSLKIALEIPSLSMAEIFFFFFLMIDSTFLILHIRSGSMPLKVSIDRSPILRVRRCYDN